MSLSELRAKLQAARSQGQANASEVQASIIDVQDITKGRPEQTSGTSGTQPEHVQGTSTGRRKRGRKWTEADYRKRGITPSEGRITLTLAVLPETKKQIDALSAELGLSYGKVVDRLVSGDA